MVHDRIFDQIDRLERGSRDIGQPSLPSQSHDRRAGWYQPDPAFNEECAAPEDEMPDQPVQLDSFDERLMHLPDHESRHAQATLGRARLSLPPARLHGQDAQPPSIAQELQPSFSRQQNSLSQYAYETFAEGPSSTSAHQSSHLSSLSSNASQHHHSEYTTDRRLHEPASKIQWRRQEPQAHLDQRADDSAYIRNGIQEAESIGDDHQPPTRPAKRSQGGPPVAQGIALVYVRELPDRLRSIFKFPLFNAIQSKCFPVLYRTNDNFVLSSPTGSGKTVILELAICRIVSMFGDGTFKIVYQAPTKALCSERQRDWQAKFGPLGLQCAELTGDTESVQLRNVQHASIIITTPEKWDSITRKWKDHQKLMRLVKLFLIDEVHILREDRGATLEAVVSRMKSIGSNVRFVALSATVPNSQDIATWLGKDSNNPQVPAPRERFGEEFRPVMLQRHICAYTGEMNDFAFEKVLNSKLEGVIAKWSQRKPLMVFCMTRKACVDTAKKLAEWWSSSSPRDRYWEAPRSRITVKDSDLRETIGAGVAFHHAGLESEERTAVEQGYLNGNINVICCTSTLAVGVNLPCHMVIIKGTVAYSKSGIQEYSDLEVMQMLGRAGRPQFDDSAVAVIMTRLKRESFYKQLVAGQEVLESRLHHNLTEHLNAEIGLGTVTNVSSAKKWLTGTFLYVRLKENPEHYKIEGDLPGLDLDERLENICAKGLAALQEHDLVRGPIQLQCTEFGHSMARYYVKLETMKRFLGLPPKAKISEILSALCMAAEFKEVRFRSGEKPAYRELNKNSGMKFPIPGDVGLQAHKVSLIIQSTLGKIEQLSDDLKHGNEYRTHKSIVFQHAHRLIRCIVDCNLHLEDSVSVRHALMLARSLGGEAWDDSPLHMCQLPQIGSATVRKLVATGIRSVEELASCEPELIERAVIRNPPFGTVTRNQAMSFPRLRITLKAEGQPTVVKDKCVSVKVKAEIGFLNDTVPETFDGKVVYICLLADTSDGRKVHFARISAKKLKRGQDVLFTAALTSAGQTIRGFVMCDEIAGTQQTATLRPEIPAFMFPAPKTCDANQKPTGTETEAPNITKRRAAHGRALEAADEFGDAGINDADLAAAEGDGFASIDDFDDDGNQKEPLQANSAHQRKVSVQRAEPTQLPSGKWPCLHKCKDKTGCKHDCCKNGLDKQPRPTKTREQKKESSVSASTSGGQKQTQLSLTKSKPTSTQSTLPTSTAPARVQERRKETYGLSRLQNSVKDSAGSNRRITSNVPSKAKAPQLQGTGNLTKGAYDEFDLDMFDSDDFPMDSPVAKNPAASKNGSPKFFADSMDGPEEMLLEEDHLAAPQSDDITNDGYINPSSYTDRHEFETQLWAPDDDVSVDDVSGDTFLEPMLPPPQPGRSIFITDNSTDGFDAVINPANKSTTSLNNGPSHPPKRSVEDVSGADLPPAKRQDLEQLLDQDFEPLDASIFDDDLLGTNMVFTQPMQQEAEAKPKEEKDDIKDWFEQNFDLSLFQFVE